MTHIAWTIGLIAGFAWHTLALPTGVALATYVLVWISASDKWKHFARQGAWGIWFALVAYQILKVAAVRTFSLGAALGPSLAVGGAVVLVLVGLCFVVIHSKRRAFRMAALALTFIVIGLVGFMPHGDRFRRGAETASIEEAGYKISASMFAAAQRGDVTQLGDLVSRGAGVNASFLGLSSLYGAVTERQLDAAVFLLDFGADVNSTNGPARRSPLHQAVLKGDVQMIKLLVSRGANLAATTTHGRTPLDYAINPPAPLTKPPNGEEIAAILKGAGAR